MPNVTTTSNVSPQPDVYFNRQLLARAKPFLIHGIPAQKARLPDGESDQMRWRRIQNLPTATVALSEGVPPSGSKLSVIDQTVQLQQYGDYITVSDKVTYIVSSPTLNDNLPVLAQQMAETLDELTRSVLETSASIYNCQYGDNGQTPTELTTKDLREVVKQLKGADGIMFEPRMGGSTNVGSEPVRAAFWMMMHTDLEVDLEELANFLPVAKYSKPEMAKDGEIGSVGNLRVLASSVGSVTSGSPDIYNMFCAARDAYGTVQLDKGMVSHIFNDAKSGGTSNPLWQYSTQGWKAFAANKLLNDSWLVNARATLDT
ncbi:N4-gp56 family major capsid protein [bacterium]|nr:N4-gp56 family major capsid protein [bacterium]